MVEQVPEIALPMLYSEEAKTGAALTIRAYVTAILLVVSSATCARADTTPCSDLPREVTAYLRANPAWSIVRFSDLLPDDQALWKTFRPKQCPGFAQVDFDGSGSKYSAIALFQKAKGRHIEKVVVLRREQGNVREHTIFAAGKVPYLCVVYTAEPGKAQDWEGAKEVSIRHESLVYEQMEAWAYQFYLSHGKFRHVQISG